MEPKEFTPDEKAGLSQKDEYVTDRGTQTISNSQNQGSKKSGFRKSRPEQKESAPQSIPRKVTTFLNINQSPRKQTSEKYKTTGSVHRPGQQSSERGDRKTAVSDYRPKKYSDERRDRKGMQSGGRRDQKVAVSDYSPRKHFSPRHDTKIAQYGGRRDQKVAISDRRPRKQSSETRSKPDIVHRSNEKRNEEIPRSKILRRQNEKRDRIIPFSENLRPSRKKSESEISLAESAYQPSKKQTKIFVAKDETPAEQRTGKQRLGQISKIHPERDRASIVDHPKKPSVSQDKILSKQGTSKQRPRQNSIHPERDRELSSRSIVYRPKKQSAAKDETLTEQRTSKQSSNYSELSPYHTSLHKVASKSVDRKQDVSNKKRRITGRDRMRERRPGMLVPWFSKMNLTKNVTPLEGNVAPLEDQTSFFEMTSDISIQKFFMYQQRESDKDWSKDLLQETDYDPHEFRESDYETSNAEALLLMIKVCLGTGIFTMPEAYKYAGLFYGVVSTFWVITFMTYGLSTLVKCQYLLCKRLKIPSITYPDTLVAALTIGPKNLRRFARNSGNILAFLILLNRFFNCTVYIIFVAKHVKAIIDQYTTKKVALEVYMVFLTIPLSVISSVRPIKFLTPIAMAANVCMLMSIGVILAYMVTSLPELHEKQGVGKIWDLPLALSTIMFAFDSVTSVAVLQNTMKEPKAFDGFLGVFSISILILSVSFTSIGFFGYWKFGDSVKSLMTMNLPPNESICQVIMVLTASAVWASYSLQVFVPIFYISRLLRSMPNSYAWEFLLRMCWVIFPLIFAASVPELKIIIPFFGSLCGPLLQFGFPALIEFCLKYSDTMTYGRWIAVVDICIIIYALTGVVTGLHSTARVVYLGRFT